MTAFVDAIAGIMFFTTPCVNDHVTPSILNSAARAAATLYSHPMCSGSSVSSFFSANELSNFLSREANQTCLHVLLAIPTPKPTQYNVLASAGCSQWCISGKQLACSAYPESIHSRKSHWEK